MMKDLVMLTTEAQVDLCSDVHFEAMPHILGWAASSWAGHQCVQKNAGCQRFCDGSSAGLSSLEHSITPFFSDS